MKLTFFSNACCSYATRTGETLLADPWLVDGAFEGSWFHVENTETDSRKLSTADYVYISHLHPDHCDEKTLSVFPRETKMVILDHGPNYLHRKLMAMGFFNFIHIKDKETKQVGDFEITMFAPFAGNVFYEAELGNLLDSAMLIKADGQSILNTNDNRPTVEAARELERRYGPLDIAQLNYNAAGPYPACFTNLSEAEKFSESERLIGRNLRAMLQVAEALKPKRVMPFAGAYLLGGKLVAKNKYLAGCTWDEAGKFLEEHGFAGRVILLRNGLSFDLDSESVDGTYRPLGADELAERIARIREEKFWYELPGEINWAELKKSLVLARENLWNFQEKKKLFPNWVVAINVGEECFSFPLNENSYAWNAPLSERYLQYSMPPRLLQSVLNFEAHWNNVEIGCHAEIKRCPNEYVPDIHTLLSFFHRPRVSSS
jgi:UDP-MurNAc hydroxylase